MIDLVNVDAGYNNKTTIKNINCSFEKGKITAILGPNGSGKSTLVKTIVGLITVFAGEIRIEQISLKSLKSKELAKVVAYVPQTRNIPAITAGKMVLHGRFPYLSYPRHYQKEDYHCVKRAMEKMGIGNLYHKEVSKLSGGEMQKVYLSMALAQDTDILILDEPTTYLDIGYQLEFMNLLALLKTAGKTIIVVLHDLNAALQYADEMIVIDHGEIVGKGTAKSVYEQMILDKTFGIKMKCFLDEQDKQYFFVSKEETN